MKKKLIAALAAAALAVIPATAALADDATLDLLVEVADTSFEGAQVTVVHGIPGADGVNVVEETAGVLIPNFNFTNIVTTTLEPGDYVLNVSTDETLDGGVFESNLEVSLEEGVWYAVVAHLDADGGLAITPFVVNGAEGISAFHTAQFPAVNIVADGAAVAENLTNGNAAQLDLEAGTSFDVVGVAAGGTTEPLALSVADVTIPEGQRILAFAVGAPAAEAEEEAVEDETMDEEMEQPAEVDSGTGGLLNNSLPMWVAALMVLGALGIAAPAVATARRR